MYVPWPGLALNFFGSKWGSPSNLKAKKGLREGQPHTQSKYNHQIPLPKPSHLRTWKADQKVQQRGLASHH